MNKLESTQEEKEKMLKKFYLFLYFIKGVKERYQGIEKLNRHHILKLLFISSLRSGELRIFNNYSALRSGPIENDCREFIRIIEEKYQKSFEDFINSEQFNLIVK